MSAPSRFRLARAALARRRTTPVPAAPSAPPVRPVADRDAMAAQWYAEGRTLQEIGDTLGVTRERVRQLLVRVEQKTGVKPKRPRASSRIDPVAVVREARASGVTSPYQVAAALSFNNATVDRVLRELGMLDAVRRLWRMRKWAPRRAAVIADLQALGAELGRTPSQKDITDRYGAGAATRIQQVFGSLRRAQAAAGFTPNAHGGGRPPGARPRDKRIASLLKQLRALGVDVLIVNDTGGPDA